MRASRILTAKLLTFTLVALTVSLVAPARAARMIGYWDGWADLPLGSISTNYDVVMLSFATGSGKDSATMTFSQSAESTSSLIADIGALHARGVKVLISVGGGGGPHTGLLNAA